jgi:hypothetical protein
VQLAARQAQRTCPQIDHLGAATRRDPAHIRRVDLLLTLEQQGNLPRGPFEFMDLWRGSQALLVTPVPETVPNINVLARLGVLLRERRDPKGSLFACRGAPGEPGKLLWRFNFDQSGFWWGGARLSSDWEPAWRPSPFPPPPTALPPPSFPLPTTATARHGRQSPPGAPPRRRRARAMPARLPPRRRHALATLPFTPATIQLQTLPGLCFHIFQGHARGRRGSRGRAPCARPRAPARDAAHHRGRARRDRRAHGPLADGRRRARAPRPAGERASERARWACRIETARRKLHQIFSSSRPKLLDWLPTTHRT